MEARFLEGLSLAWGDLEPPSHRLFRQPLLCAVIPALAALAARTMAHRRVFAVARSWARRCGGLWSPCDGLLVGYCVNDVCSRAL